MKIIGVTGGCGAGKSTVSKRLEEILPNSLLIKADVFMLEESDKLENDILKSIGREKDENVYSFNYYHESLENIKTWVSVIEKDVIEQIENIIKTEKDKKDYIIIDWVFLPLCKIFKECDYTVCIKAESGKRLERLINRLKDRTIYKEFNGSYWSYKPEILEKRVKYTALNDFGYKSNYEISNEGNLDVLYGKVDKIVSEMKLN